MKQLTNTKQAVTQLTALVMATLFPAISFATTVADVTGTTTDQLVTVGQLFFVIAGIAGLALVIKGLINIRSQKASGESPGASIGLIVVGVALMSLTAVIGIINESTDVQSSTTTNITTDFR